MVVSRWLHVPLLICERAPSPLADTRCSQSSSGVGRTCRSPFASASAFSCSSPTLARCSPYCRSSASSSCITRTPWVPHPPRSSRSPRQRSSSSPSSLAGASPSLYGPARAAMVRRVASRLWLRCGALACCGTLPCGPANSPRGRMLEPLPGSGRRGRTSSAVLKAACHGPCQLGGGPSSPPRAVDARRRGHRRGRHLPLVDGERGQASDQAHQGVARGARAGAAAASLQRASEVVSMARRSVVPVVCRPSAMQEPLHLLAGVQPHPRIFPAATSCAERPLWRRLRCDDCARTGEAQVEVDVIFI